MKEKKIYYFFIHILFVTGVLYAFAHFITTPRSDMLIRRLWAYESWIIVSFYSLFVFLTLTEKELKLSKIKKPKLHLQEFTRIMTVLLVLLIFPWGLFLLLAPADLLELLELNRFFLRIIGLLSLAGALVYYFPLRFYKKNISYYILIFGSISNLFMGLFLTGMFLFNDVNLITFSSAPLLFYFASFFREQAVKYKHLTKK